MTAIVFTAIVSATQSLPPGVNTKINLNVAPINVGGAFDTVNARFRPNVAGYYQISARAMLDSVPAGNNIGTFLYLNGATVSAGITNPGALETPMGPMVTDIFLLNGSTDYVELYVGNGGPPTLNLQPSSVFTEMSGFLLYEVVTQPPARSC
ncbi:MAG: hypothetical protein JO128_19990 [Alphaproteobacteria bacterium]|nr:hypothetical protein [Alphaproteobacteria bacterium]